LEAKPAGKGGPYRSILFSTTRIQEFGTIDSLHGFLPWGVETEIAGKVSPQSDVTKGIIEGGAREELPFPVHGCLTTWTGR